MAKKTKAKRWRQKNLKDPNAPLKRADLNRSLNQLQALRQDSVFLVIRLVFRLGRLNQKKAKVLFNPGAGYGILEDNGLG